jgi:hypothetical protein
MTALIFLSAAATSSKRGERKSLRGWASRAGHVHRHDDIWIGGNTVTVVNGAIDLTDVSRSDPNPERSRAPGFSRDWT